MDINNLTKDELEKMSYLDMAYNILKFNKKVFNTVELLKEICKVLNYDDNKFEQLIGDFYTSLNLDKRFLLIDGKWDLAENHAVKIMIEDDLEDDLDEYEDLEDLDEDEDEIEDELISEDIEVLEDIDDELEDDLEDLEIIDEDEIEEEI